MLDGRFHFNSAPLEAVLTLLSTISFTDSVDEIDDQLDIKDKHEKGDLFFFFSRQYLDFFRLFLLERFNISRFDEGDFFSFPLACVIYLAFLFRKSQRFLIPSLLAHHMSYLQLYHFLPCLKTGVNYRGNNACIILICMQRSSIFKLFYCIEYIS